MSAVNGGTYEQILLRNNRNSCSVVYCVRTNHLKFGLFQPDAILCKINCISRNHTSSLKHAYLILYIPSKCMPRIYNNITIYFGMLEDPEVHFFNHNSVLMWFVCCQLRLSTSDAHVPEIMASTDVRLQYHSARAHASISAYLPGEGLAVEEMLWALSVFAAKV